MTNATTDTGLIERDADPVTNALAAIDAHRGPLPLTLFALAEIAGVGPFALHRSFVNQTGMTPVEYAGLRREHMS